MKVITIREDALLLMELLKQVKKRTGSLTPQWFMSDDADQYFNSMHGEECLEKTALKKYCAVSMLIGHGGLPCIHVTQWASCFRTQTIVNTNMFVESFHWVLKVVYLQHKQS